MLQVQEPALQVRESLRSGAIARGDAIEGLKQPPWLGQTPTPLQQLAVLWALRHLLQTREREHAAQGLVPLYRYR